jgi:hypothetical protein
MSSETGFHVVSPSQHAYQPNVSHISVVAHEQVVAHLFFFFFFFPDSDILMPLALDVHVRKSATTNLSQ